MTKTPEFDKIEGLVGTLFDPIIVWPGGWDIPDWLKKKIPLDRILEEQKPHPTAANSEVTAYLMTASLARPMSRDWHDIYLHVANEEFKREGTQMPPGVPVPALSGYQVEELNKIKRWIYDQRLKNRAGRLREQKPVVGRPHPPIAPPRKSIQVRKPWMPAGVQMWQVPLADFLSWQKARYPDADDAEIYQWKMTAHRPAVRKALKEGKPVPPEVLKDYPGMAAHPERGNPRRKMELHFDPNIWGRWQLIAELGTPRTGYYIGWGRQHKNVELRPYPYSKLSLVQISGQGNIFGVTALTFAHSVFPVTGGKPAPVRGHIGLKFFEVYETAPSLAVARRKAEELKKTIARRFDQVTRDTMRLKNPTLLIPIKSSQQQEDIWKAERALLRAGVSFDTGTDISRGRPTRRDWELDWSLKGAKLRNPTAAVINHIIDKAKLLRERKQYIYPGRSVHITRRDLGNKVELRPSKEYTPVGVSFAPTIRYALEGVPYYYTNTKDWKRRRQFVKEGDEWNVYTPVRKRLAVIPSTIDDFKRTRERRVLSKVVARWLGRVRVKVGNNRWEYKWIYRTNPPAAVIDRIADKAMELWQGDLAGTVKWLESLGCKVVHQTEHAAAVKGLTGMTVGLTPADPVTCAVQLGFALAGPFWPQAYHGLLEEVNRRWKGLGMGYSRAGKRQ